MKDQEKQARLLQKSKKAISFSHVLNQTIRDCLRN